MDGAYRLPAAARSNPRERHAGPIKCAVAPGFIVLVDLLTDECCSKAPPGSHRERKKPRKLPVPLRVKCGHAIDPFGGVSCTPIAAVVIALPNDTPRVTLRSVLIPAVSWHRALDEGLDLIGPPRVDGLVADP